MIYLYACEACCHQFEREQRITATPIRQCPRCKRRRARRMIAPGGSFVLKGGNWAANGYGN